MFFDFWIILNPNQWFAKLLFSCIWHLRLDHFLPKRKEKKKKKKKTKKRTFALLFNGRLSKMAGYRRKSSAVKIADSAW